MAQHRIEESLSESNSSYISNGNKRINSLKDKKDKVKRSDASTTERIEEENEDESDFSHNLGKSKKSPRKNEKQVPTIHRKWNAN